MYSPRRNEENRLQNADSTVSVHSKQQLQCHLGYKRKRRRATKWEPNFALHMKLHLAHSNPKP